MNRILAFFLAALISPATAALTQEDVPDGGLKYDPSNPGAFRSEEEARDFAAKKRKKQYEEARAKALAAARDKNKAMSDLARAGDAKAAEDLEQLKKGPDKG